MNEYDGFSIFSNIGGWVGNILSCSPGVLMNNTFYIPKNDAIVEQKHNFKNFIHGFFHFKQQIWLCLQGYTLQEAISKPSWLVYLQAQKCSFGNKKFFVLKVNILNCEHMSSKVYRQNMHF